MKSRAHCRILIFWRLALAGPKAEIDRTLTKNAEASVELVNRLEAEGRSGRQGRLVDYRGHFTSSRLELANSSVSC
jgi:hypothetical protein